MNARQYDNLNDIQKELFLHIIKTQIRTMYPPKEAENYCQQIDEEKVLIEWLKKMVESNKHR
jgi:hypothetical protein